MVSPGEDHDVAGQGVVMMSPVLARGRQLMANFL
ncbi:hypothetical protein A2U01_0101690, partial [Trifolium medium]|nr:hypothetical protein [Trifolium medium]